MALSVIVALYISIGLMSAAGSIAISKKVFSEKAQQVFFGLFMIPVAGFYLAFTAYFGNQEAWRLEAFAVALFTVLGVLGCRVTVVLVLAYVLHGFWDMLHELQAHAGVAFDIGTGTQIPLAYGIFCATYDWCMAAYFYTRRREWSAAWGARTL
jgi:hypothetical protein